MRKKVNWWWVVATHKRGNVREAEYDALSMIAFLDWCIAARVFTCKRDAEEWINERKRLKKIPKGITLRIISDEAWQLTMEMYLRGKSFGL